VKVLAVLTKDRSPLLPDVPTAREQGVDVTDGYYWNAFFVPKGTPEPIVTALGRAVSTAMDSDAVQKRIRDAAATVVPADRRSGAHLREYMKGEVPKWAAIMKANDVEQQ
jgi:tripartite-type tricarboxylate transporter receptor subunit TctC